ncbi:MAG TPA: hypothetical protein V6C98_13870 [Thermosynechococcaceae cyanobacterium]
MGSTEALFALLQRLKPLFHVAPLLRSATSQRDRSSNFQLASLRHGGRSSVRLEAL